LIARIHTVIDAADMFLAEHGFSLKALVEAKNFEKMGLLKDAADALCESLEVKKTFQTYASELGRLMKYADRDDVTEETRAQKDAILAIHDQLQKKRKHANNVDLMVQINSIISEYVQLQPQEEALTPSKQFDISRIDFDLLQREFARASRKRLVLKDLEDLVQERLQMLLFVNPNRINYYERYQEIIQEYNSEQDRATIEKTFMDLMDLANSMNQEEQRFVREGFSSDEELSLYDMLFRDDLSKTEIKKIKEVSVSLLQKIKAKIAELDHWTDKQETKAMVDTLIRDTLWAELPESYDSLSITEYRHRIYEYVFTRYKEVAA